MHRQQGKLGKAKSTTASNCATGLNSSPQMHGHKGHLPLPGLHRSVALHFVRLALVQSIVQKADQAAVEVRPHSEESGTAVVQVCISEERHGLGSASFSGFGEFVNLGVQGRSTSGYPGLLRRRFVLLLSSGALVKDASDILLRGLHFLSSTNVKSFQGDGALHSSYDLCKQILQGDGSSWFRRSILFVRIKVSFDHARPASSCFSGCLGFLSGKLLVILFLFLFVRLLGSVVGHIEIRVSGCGAVSMQVWHITNGDVNSLKLRQAQHSVEQTSQPVMTNLSQHQMSKLGVLACPQTHLRNSIVGDLGSSDVQSAQCSALQQAAQFCSSAIAHGIVPQHQASEGQMSQRADEGRDGSLGDRVSR
mmetsp:Transcript_8166/g.17800  ORF Transcript_8166/g.17800 Transcript_8166/m.17800 type:complete len:364 (-) Transcript_8166:169-1260(-)